MKEEEKQKSEQAETIVEKVLSIEKEADEIIANARAKEKEISDKTTASIEALRKETDARISSEIARLNADVNRRVAEEKEALDKMCKETLEQITSIPPALLESCAKEIVLKILAG
jgi:F0F1-type ATP synthase membrane subunit b/b'